MIANSELLFEQYRMALNQDKYEIEVRNDDAIKCYQIFFDFMQQTLNRLYGLYLHGKTFLLDTIIKNKLRKQSEAKIEKLNREKIPGNKINEVTSKPSSKKSCFVNKTTRKS